MTGDEKRRVREKEEKMECAMRDAKREGAVAVVVVVFGPRDPYYPFRRLPDFACWTVSGRTPSDGMWMAGVQSDGLRDDLTVPIYGILCLYIPSGVPRGLRYAVLFELLP